MFYYNLKMQRLKCGLSQKQVAEFLCVSPQSISKWEKGESLPSIDFLPRLAECFDCDINAFFKNEEKYCANYAIINPLFAMLVDEITNGFLKSEELAAYILTNPDAIDMAMRICTDLMGYKTLNTKSIRGMLDCSEVDAKTFIGYLEKCEMVEKLDIDGAYYIVKDAVEGFIVVMKIRKQLCDMINQLH